MVNYPNALCPQVLPKELKQLAIDRLDAVKENLQIVKDFAINEDYIYNTYL